MSASGSESSSGSPYRGRFAPSPTGPLHFGSLITALASFLRARSQQGVWLVRMEDLDPPREMPGAADEILRTLEALELHWDETVRYQSSRHEAYEAALAQLREQGRAYACGCTRSEIAAAQRGDQQGEEPVYPGTCRSGLAPGREPRAWRVLTHGEPIHFDDLLQGPQRHVLEQICGDFVVRRADQLFAYQLAVVVDDADQRITEVVRGCDLLDSTTRQIHLQRLLDLATPRYLHLPLVLDPTGVKLSKQTGATPVSRRHGATALHSALAFLGQKPPDELARASASEVLAWGQAHWDLGSVPRLHGCAAQTL